MIARTLAGVLALAAFAPAWTPQVSGVGATLRAVSTVNDRIAWASGSAGTVLRTEDGGATWKRIAVPDAMRLDFRDLSGFRSVVAYIPGERQSLIAVGPQGADVSTDDGRSWTSMPSPGYHTLSVSRTGRVAFGAGARGAIGRFTR